MAGSMMEEAAQVIKMASRQVVVRSMTHMADEGILPCEILIWAVIVGNNQRIAAVQYTAGPATLDYFPRCRFRYPKSEAGGLGARMAELLELWKPSSGDSDDSWFRAKPVIASQVTGRVAHRLVSPGNPFLLQHYAVMAELMRFEIEDRGAHGNNMELEWSLYHKVQRIIENYNRALMRVGMGFGNP